MTDCPMKKQQSWCMIIWILCIDPELRGLLSSIGIQKGKEFAPDERMKTILTEAVAVGNATARAIEKKYGNIFYHYVLAVAF